MYQAVSKDCEDQSRSELLIQLIELFKHLNRFPLFSSRFRLFTFLEGISFVPLVQNSSSHPLIPNRLRGAIFTAVQLETTRI